MTTRGKIVLTIVLLAVVGFGVYRWWDKIAPQSRPQNVSVDVAKVKDDIAKARAVPVDIPLLAGTNVATLVERSGIPAVSGCRIPHQRLARLGAHHHGQRRHGAE
jgi:hypothetical protein